MPGIKDTFKVLNRMVADGIVERYAVAGAVRLLHRNRHERVMSSRPPNIYPDISDILARKARGRRQMASLSFSEKLEILDTLRARVEPIRRSRESRKKR